VPGAVRQILGFFENERGGLLPHELLVEDEDLQEAFSLLLGAEREAAGLPVVEVETTPTIDAASRFARAELSLAFFQVQEAHERQAPQRSRSARAPSLTSWP
jgi:hypothetical protein